MNRQNILWTIFPVATAIAIAGFTYFLALPANSDDISYLLSALSQGLAAIFALVFIITIFGAEMQRKFTALDRMIDKWTIFLMIIFAIGIILPLLQLRTDMNLVNMNFIDSVKLFLSLNLGIATFCILSIIPYLIRVNRIMKYEGGISKLHEDALNAIDLNRTSTAIFKLHELKDLFFNASNDDLEFKAIIIEIIADIGKIVIEKKSELLTQHVLEILGDIGVKAVDKTLRVADHLIADKAIIRLRETCISAIENDFGELVFYVSSEDLFKIGYKYLLNNIVKPGKYSNYDGIVIFKFWFFDVTAPKRIASWDIPNYLALKSLLEITEAVYNKLYEDEPVRSYLRSIKSRNDLKKLHEYTFGKTLEISLVYIWVLGAFVVRYSSGKATENALHIKLSKHNVVKDLFERKIYRELAATFIHNRIIRDHDIDFMGLKQDDFMGLKQDLEEFARIYDSC